MKTFRLALFFLIGLFFGGFATYVSAETIPATSGGTLPKTIKYNSVWATGAATPQLACGPQTWYPNGCATANGGCNSAGESGAYYCISAVESCPAGYTSMATECVQVGYSCPETGGWTLSGSTCNRPDQTPCPVFSGSLPGDDSQAATKPDSCTCPAGTKWFPYNGCRKSCDASGVANAGFDLAIAKGAATGCFSGCEVQHGSGAYDVLKDGSHSAQATYTGWACAGTGVGAPSTADGQPQPDSSQLDPTKKHPPKCGSGEGVITSSSGNVLCLPAGTPNTSTPKVESSKKTETFPDSSTKTTETTKTTDPNTGATSTSTTSTSTGGQSGEAGTTSSTENGTGKDGDGDGDGDGECDPTLHFCGGPATDKLYTKKEKTMESVFQQFKTTISGSGLGSATTGFFNVSAPGGSCPSWSVQVPYLNVTLSGADIFCGGAILAALQGAGAVMLALATYIAFTWAFL